MIVPALRAAGATAIEVAPGRVFPYLATATLAEARAFARDWSGRGLPPLSMQALLFGRPDLHLLQGADEAARLVDYLGHVIGLAGALGCGPLVFGSPRNRLRGDLDFAAACERAVPVFRALGDLCAKAATTLCLEANAKDYGCDFMTTLAEAAAVVRAVDHPRVGLVVDTGNMIMEGEEAEAVLPVLDLVRHVHVSAPRLGDPAAHMPLIRDVMARLRAGGYAGQVTLEMLPPADGSPSVADSLLGLAHTIGAGAGS